MDTPSAPPSFAVLRVAKVRTLQALRGASDHNARTAAAGLDHTQTPAEGPGVVLLDGQTDAVAAWHARTASVGLGKPRKDAVRAIEVVMSASPAWFAGASQAERAEWVASSMDWARQFVGPENVLQAVHHRDETTDHIHVLAVPLTQKERSKAGRPRKGREGAARPSGPSWGLSADDLIGDPAKLVAAQTDYAARLAPLGLRRGRPKRATGARHKSAAHSRDEAAEDRAAAAAERQQAEAFTTRRRAALEASGETLGQAKTIRETTLRTAEAFTTGLDAISAGELVYRAPEADQKATLARVQVETPILPQKPEGLRSWRLSAAPVWNALVGYAQRLAGVKAREAEVQTAAEAIERVAERQARAEERNGQTQGPARQDAAAIQEAIRAKLRPPMEAAEFADPPGQETRERGQARGRERSRG